MSYRVKLGLRDLSVSELMFKMQNVIQAMTGNANFPTPNPPLADMQTAFDELVAAANAAAGRDKFKIVIRNEKRTVVENQLRVLAFYVNSVNNTDRGIMESSGFEVVERGDPIGMLPAIQNLRGTSEPQFPGTIKLEWNTVHGASSYIVEITQTDPSNPETAWEEIGHPQKTRFFAEGLTPGMIYWFRVIPVGSAGLGGISTPLLSRAA